MNKNINIKKYWWLILVFILTSSSLLASLVLLQQRQEIRKEAAVPAPQGQATVSISPESGTYQVGETIPVNVFFNTKGVTISAVALRITYPYSGSSPKVVPANILINQALLNTGDWSCPIKTISSEGGIVKIDIACANVNPAGYSNNTDTLLASFNLGIQDIPTPNPVVLSFDQNLSVFTSKSDNKDVLLAPTSRGTYAIASTPTSFPTCESRCFYGKPQCSARVTPKPGYSCQLNYNCPSCNRRTGEWCWAYCIGSQSTPTPVPSRTPTPTGTLRCDSKCSFGKSQCERDNQGKTGGSCQINPACPGVPDDNYQSYWRWSYCW
jgi:hypothetical protein